MITIQIHYKNGQVEEIEVELERAGDKMEELAEIESIAWMHYSYRQVITRHGGYDGSN